MPEQNRTVAPDRLPRPPPQSQDHNHSSAPESQWAGRGGKGVRLVPGWKKYFAEQNTKCPNTKYPTHPRPLPIIITHHHPSSSSSSSSSLFARTARLFFSSSSFPFASSYSTMYDTKQFLLLLRWQQPKAGQEIVLQGININIIIVVNCKL